MAVFTLKERMLILDPPVLTVRSQFQYSECMAGFTIFGFRVELCRPGT
jgi:hypothetical protein